MIFLKDYFKMGSAYLPKLTTIIKIIMKDRWSKTDITVKDNLLPKIVLKKDFLDKVDLYMEQ